MPASREWLAWLAGPAWLTWLTCWLARGFFCTFLELGEGLSYSDTLEVCTEMGLTPPPLHGDDLFDDDVETGSGLDLHAVCEQAVSRVRDELHAKQPIQTDFGPMAQVAAPRGDFFQVMVNILLNAEDVARRLDADRGSVVLSTHGGSDHAVVLVRASAPPAAQSSVAAAHPNASPAATVRWEHFGMPVCQKILGSFGGTLSLETDEATGTTFRVTVPVPRRTVRPPIAVGTPPASLRHDLAFSPPSKVITPSASFPTSGPSIRKQTKEFAVVVPPKKKV